VARMVQIEYLNYKQINKRRGDRGALQAPQGIFGLVTFNSRRKKEEFLTMYSRRWSVDD
jgi:hypothetical protein